MPTTRSGLFLLKFVEPQFTESTLDGNIFFKRNGYFIDQEKVEMDKGIGDEREGIWSRLLNPETKQMFIEDEQGNMHPLNYISAVHRKTYTSLRNIPICCFVILDINRDFDIDMDNGTATIKYAVNEALINQFEGRDMIFFNDHSALLKRMDTKCEELDVGKMRAIVKYYDDEKEEHPLSEIEYEDNPGATLFFKRKFFEYQKEFRYAIRLLKEEDFMLQIGDIRDIAYDYGKVKKGDSLIDVWLRPQEQK
ncbi:hypothetical protein QWY16_07590 [Planococcus shenhongbingii]|uniref:hypothetical protein n=1 Tax=Planococcus shenhongbingii TaxID=3058398 RepID=UPI0026139BDE|nr:hypothetical protein [Planococcus sp. N016]WKA59959.1 hypothetical protein QWY16_07590 [Planococcus sp. N016]